jgi:hypothetical protein
MLASTIRRLITYVHAHAFMSECRMLQAPFLNANTNCRNVICDSCDGRIGGPRLSCLDCVVKSTEMYSSLELCCTPQCVGARVTHRGDLEGVHEPSHRLVKFRTPVLTRSHGRAHTAACDAYERVGETCRKIAEFTSHPDEETGPDEQNTSNFGPTSKEMPAESDKPDDVLNPPDGTKGGAEVESKAAKDAKEDQVQEESLPTCGKCEGRLSFPFWYCIFCEGQFSKMTLFTFMGSTDVLCY